MVIYPGNGEVASTMDTAGSDRGIDGRLYFHDEAGSAKTKQIVFSPSPKSSKANACHPYVSSSPLT